MGNRHANSIPASEVALWTAAATQQLLGYTIGLDDSAWHEQIELPGWTRAHVATHLSRGADHLAAVVSAAVEGRVSPEGPFRRQRQRELELGADRDGLEIQVDLDSSAGALQRSFESVSDWEVPIRLHGRSGPLAMAALSRLHEVCIHYLDLDPDAGPDALEPAAAAWLLRWVLDLLADAPPTGVAVSGETLSATVGQGRPTRTVSGTDARLWAWLSGREPAESVTGADGLRPPLLG